MSIFVFSVGDRGLVITALTQGAGVLKKTKAYGNSVQMLFR